MSLLVLPRANLCPCFSVCVVCVFLKHTPPWSCVLVCVAVRWEPGFGRCGRRKRALDSLLPLRCGAAKASLCCVSVLRWVLSRLQPAFVRLCAASLRQSPVAFVREEVEVSFGAQTRQTEANWNKRHKSTKFSSGLRSKEVFWFWWVHVRLCCPGLWSLLLQDQDQRDDDVLAALPAAL